MPDRIRLAKRLDEKVNWTAIGDAVQALRTLAVELNNHIWPSSTDHFTTRHGGEVIAQARIAVRSLDDVLISSQSYLECSEAKKAFDKSAIKT